jgi:adenylate cyclase class 2
MPTNTPEMLFEVENKYRIDDSDRLLEQLTEIGTQFGSSETQVDHYFAHPARDFRLTDEALRIRRCGALNFVTYKGPKIDTATKTRRELELPIEPGDHGAARFAELLTSLGFAHVAEVRKQRRHGAIDWQGRTVAVALDEVALAGNFLELELIATREELPAAQASVLALAAKLGLAEIERRSYLRMVLEQLGATT